ncbi:endochitinase-like isoform X2 [Ornithodoros turicata]|uniref:endochitinase-like isoform X2 n=1 Tax=Ornithodoros turicata TaxID=34597 RepID=UPI00313A192B
MWRRNMEQARQRKCKCASSAAEFDRQNFTPKRKRFEASVPYLKESMSQGSETLPAAGMMRLLLMWYLISVATYQGAMSFGPKYNHRRHLPVVCHVNKYSYAHTAPYDYQTTDIPTHLCSHVNYAFADIEENTWKVKDVPGNFRNFTALKSESPRLKVMLSIGGWSDQSNLISKMASSRKNRRKFLHDIFATLKTYDFDGLDIFWLFPGFQERGGVPEDKGNFVRLVKEFREAMVLKNATHLELTAAVPLSPFVLDNGYDIFQLNRYLDWMYVIAYELRGKWLSETDVHSPIVTRSIDPPDLRQLNVRDGMRDLFERGAFKRKVLMGIAFYGRSYKLRSAYNTGLHAPIDVNGNPRPGPILNSSEIYSYTEICRFLQNDSWTRRFDYEGECPYAFSGDEWTGYDDEESIRYKMNLMRDEGYAGVMVMSSDMDDFRGACGKTNILLHAINDELPLERDVIYPLESLQEDGDEQ